MRFYGRKICHVEDENQLMFDLSAFCLICLFSGFRRPIGTRWDDLFPDTPRPYNQVVEEVSTRLFTDPPHLFSPMPRQEISSTSWR